MYQQSLNLFDGPRAHGAHGAHGAYRANGKAPVAAAAAFARASTEPNSGTQTHFPDVSASQDTNTRLTELTESTGLVESKKTAHRDQNSARSYQNKTRTRQNKRAARRANSVESNTSVDHLAAARRLQRRLRKAPVRSPEEIRAGRLICRHLVALLQASQS